MKKKTEAELATMHVYLDEDKKALIKQEYGIDVDSELFDPRLDFVSKRILAADTEESKKALVSFLNAALKLKNKKRVVKVLNPVTTVESSSHKKSIFDVRVEFLDGSEAIIEIEFRKKDDFKRRSQFLISRSYASQDIAGKTYDALDKRYIVCVLNYTLLDDEEDDDFYRDYMYRDRKGRPLTDDLNIIFVELTKLDDLLKKPVNKLTPIECWALFFRHSTDKDKRELLSQIIEKEEGIKVATQILQTISQNKEERRAYEEQLIFELDQRSEVANARKQGIEQGAKAKEIEIAKGLKLDNVPFSVIVKNTTLTLREIEAL
ncbi:MAG: Rpn family recombination-promoting nuclease/putative transposase [Defluviitaleaceae bacterium]|nr:Rpn family recombination-promoting nuclease/putative transposase [Defluviitaleaceae bacterium]